MIKLHIHQKEEKLDFKQKVKNILKDAGKQIFVSLIILVIGFFALNWSAYYQIFQNEWAKLWGEEQASPLNKFTNEKIVYNQQVLKTSTNPQIQKKQIPQLNFEVAPPDNRIIIPRIDQNLPIVRISSESLIKRNWNALEKEIQEALRDGVVHYPGTSFPGQGGNVAITGHSSYFPWDSGRFKDVFALLHEVVKGDKIVIYYEQNKYIYEVDDIKIVLPEEIDILKQTPEEKLTLITCTPVGTNLKRLIVIAKPVAVNNRKISQKVLR